MFALDLYNNTFARAILKEAVAELTQLEIRTAPSCIVLEDLLRMLRKLDEELYAFNSTSVLTKFNIDRRNQSILVQRHLSVRISNDFYVKLLANTDAIANALKSTTLENILEDFEKINAVKVVVTQRWEESRQEQKEIEVDERMQFLAKEIDRRNELIDGVQQCRQKVNSFHNSKLLKLKQQIDHWKYMLREELEDMAKEIKERQLLLEEAVKQSHDIEKMTKERQEVIDNFNDEQKNEEN